MVQMQRPRGCSAWDTGAELADVTRCLNAEMDKIISMTNPYAKKNKIPGGHAEEFGRMFPPPADQSGPTFKNVQMLKPEPPSITMRPPSNTAL